MMKKKLTIMLRFFVVYVVSLAAGFSAAPLAVRAEVWDGTADTDCISMHD
ncbi:MAG: hypothetical protein GX638_04685 [Crenarchaeota archaeon]|nr:hypothetical protein [Thermoproteota archaeon]